MSTPAEPRVACVMMQKDEAHVLGSWLAYHGYLFGLQNLWVFDNGSTLPAVLATLAAFEGQGVNIIRSFARHQDYVNKGILIGDLIAELDATGQYDFLIPSDCDEFIVKQTNGGFTCDRAIILAYLSRFRGEGRVLRIPFQLANNPYRDDCYVWFEFFKTFFAKGTFLSLDQGHHLGKSRKSPDRLNTAIVHIHYHYPSYDRVKDTSRKKWLGEVPLDHLNSAVEYTGPFKHVVGNFFMEEQEYIAQFAQKPQFYLPSFRHLLRQLGHPIGACGPAAPDLGETGRVPLLLPPERAANLPAMVYFDRAYYAERNPDVIAANVAPLFHFCQFGFKEGRWPCEPDEFNARLSAT